MKGFLVDHQPPVNGAGRVATQEGTNNNVDNKLVEQDTGLETLERNVGNLQTDAVKVANGAYQIGLVTAGTSRRL